MKISQQSLGISVLLTFTLFFFSMKITSQLSWRITITSLTPCLEMDQSETGKINHRAENSIMEGWQVGSTRPDIQLATVSHHLECTCFLHNHLYFFVFVFLIPALSSYTIGMMRGVSREGMRVACICICICHTDLHSGNLWI